MTRSSFFPVRPLPSFISVPYFFPLLLSLTGCATSRIYSNGINHLYLCSVRVVRAHGYQVREQDFKQESGTLIAGRSTPDPKSTVMSPGFFRRTKEVVWNAWEHSRFEFWDDDDAVRVRTDERVVIKFRQGSGWLAWLTHHPKSDTQVTVSADITEYGKEDWVIKRDDKPAEVRDAIFQSISECVSAATPSVYTAKIKAARPAVSLPPVVAAVAAPQPVSAVAPAAPVAAPAPVATAPSATPVTSSAAVPVGVSPASATSPVVSAPAVVPAADPAGTLNEARKLYERAKYAAAIPMLASVVAAEPDNVEALGYLGAAYYQVRKLDEAIATYEVYSKLLPSDTRTVEFIEEMKKERAESAK